MRAAEVAGDLREVLFADHSRRRPLQAVDQRGERDLRPIAQMHVIVLAVERLQCCPEIGISVVTGCRDFPHALCQNSTAVFGREHQVCVRTKTR